jgi:hypothetical protein
MILRWNGTSWQTSTHPVTSNAQLRGVSCNDANNCLAVGFAAGRSLALRWDGTTWTPTSAADYPSSTTSSLASVACTSASDCIAAGTATLNAGAQTRGYATRWDGTSWTLASFTPPPNARYRPLNGVSCNTTTTCVAVGEDLSWQQAGASWNPVLLATAPLTTINALALSCPTATSECTAVGSVRPSGSATTAALAEHWDGTSWTTATMPALPAGSSLLSGVDCAVAGNCVAVGNQAASTLAIVWDGTNWTVTPTVNGPAGSSSQLRAASCTNPTNCWAIGAYAINGNTYSLIEAYQ